MRTHVLRVAQVGDLVAVAFDVASSYSADPREVSRLATKVVTRLLRHARRSSRPAPRPPALPAER